MVLLQILDAVDSLKEQGWEYELEASYIEVYNETYRDLLAEGRGRDAGKITDQNAVKHGVGGVPLQVGPQHCNEGLIIIKGNPTLLECLSFLTMTC